MKTTTKGPRSCATGARAVAVLALAASAAPGALGFGAVRDAARDAWGAMLAPWEGPGAGPAAEAGAECPVAGQLRIAPVEGVARACAAAPGVAADVELGNARNLTGQADACRECFCGLGVALAPALVHGGCAAPASLQLTMADVDVQAVAVYVGQCRAAGHLGAAEAPKPSVRQCSATLAAAEAPELQALAQSFFVGPLDTWDDAEVDMARLLTDRLDELGRDDLVSLLGVAGEGDINAMDGPQMQDALEAIELVGDFTAQLADPAAGAGDASALCPGVSNVQSCRQFKALRDACPLTCEMASDHCLRHATASSCQSQLIRGQCPKVCQIVEEQEPVGSAAAAVNNAFPAFEAAGNSEECACMEVWQPVCDAATGVMYGNLCQAKCQGVGATVDCSETAPQASFEGCAAGCRNQRSDPVCSVTTGREFRNPCHAKCAGVSAISVCGSLEGRDPGVSFREEEDSGAARAPLLAGTVLLAGALGALLL